jgi:hypothetical protein
MHNVNDYRGSARHQEALARMPEGAVFKSDVCVDWGGTRQAVCDLYIQPDCSVRLATHTVPVRPDMALLQLAEAELTTDYKERFWASRQTVGADERVMLRSAPRPRLFVSEARWRRARREAEATVRGGDNENGNEETQVSSGGAGGNAEGTQDVRVDGASNETEGGYEEAQIGSNGGGGGADGGAAAGSSAEGMQGAGTDGAGNTDEDGGMRVGQKRSRGKTGGKKKKLTGNQRSGGGEAEAE